MRQASRLSYFEAIDRMNESFAVLARHSHGAVAAPL
jgi:hypothetical protein